MASTSTVTRVRLLDYRSVDEINGLEYRNEAPAMLGAIWPLVMLAAVFIWLRVYCKFRRHRGLWWDDYMLVMSWIAIFLNVTIHTRRVTLGFGKFVDLIPMQNRHQLGMLNGLAVTFGIFGVAWSKTSFALSLLRIATQTWYRRLIIFIMMSMNGFLNSGIVLIWLQPRECWLAGSTNACIPGSAAVGGNIAANAYSGLMDVVLAGIPWVILWNVQMKRKEKIGVAVAMSMGLVGAIAAVIKCHEISKVTTVNISGFGAPPSLVIWGVVEVTVTIIAASIPVLRMLIIEIRGSSAERSRSRAIEAVAELAKSVRGSSNGSKLQKRVAEDAWNMNSAMNPVYELEADIGDIHFSHSEGRSTVDLEMGVIHRHGSTEKLKEAEEIHELHQEDKVHEAPADTPKEKPS